MNIIQQIIIVTFILLNMVCNKPTLADIGPTTSELIDSLVNISEYGIGFHPRATFCGFIAIDSNPKFNGGILGSGIPRANAHMIEIVRRGATAVPVLLEHLRDKRSTKLTVGDSNCLFGAQVFGHEYDPRNSHSQNQRMADILNATPIKGKYTLKIGDICYCLIGQIVNRELNAVRYRPTSIIIVNSPVENSMLRKMVCLDWNAFTVKDHVNHLMNDLKTAKDNMHLRGAYKRIKFYYPEYIRKLMINDMNDAITRAKDLFEIAEKN